MERRGGKAAGQSRVSDVSARGVEQWNLGKGGTGRKGSKRWNGIRQGEIVNGVCGLIIYQC